MKQLIEQNIRQLEEIYSFLLQIDNQFYQEPLKCLFKSSIGMHVRHVLEFYDCLSKFDRLQSTINYDKRERNTKLENNLSFALEKIEFIMLQLNSNHFKDTSLIVESGLDDSIENHLSSVKRELLYLQEHTTHHMATIKIAAMIHNENISLPENFGVAQSTLAFNKTASN